MNNNRIVSLDYLRGLAAVSIMLYHYCSWTFGKFSAENILTRVGLYGVSIFYVLSGLTLFIVYQDKISIDKSTILDFMIKRIFRIFPLFWLVTTATILLRRQIPDGGTLFLNYTGLFGFIKPEVYIGTGVWSIGNELVFYAFFPLFVILSKYYGYLFYVLAILLFGVGLYFASTLLNTSGSLSSQWKTYINPFNQIFLFLGGYLIGLYFSHARLNKTLLRVILVLAITMFCLFPVAGDPINLIANKGRLVFSLICFAICFSVFLYSYQLPKVINNLLVLLGESSYSIYLLHPVVFPTVKPIVKVLCNLFEMKGQLFAILSTSILITLILSHIIYNRFERPLMKIGRELSRKLNDSCTSC